MKKVIIFNAPPRSGKDMVCDWLNDKYGYTKLSFKSKLIEMAARFFDMSVDEFMQHYDEQEVDGSWFKDVELYTLAVGNEYYSQRTALQHVSENVAKPMFGDGVFGHALAEQMKGDGVYVVSDGGFDAELQPIIDAVDYDNILIIEIERKGCTFDGDTRDYFTVSDCWHTRMVNNGTEEEFFNKVDNLITEFLI